RKRRQRYAGWRVMQMALREGEYAPVIEPLLRAAGLSESSFLRVQCGLPALEPGGAGNSGKRAGRKRKKGGHKAGKNMPFVGTRPELTDDDTAQLLDMLDQTLGGTQDTRTAGTSTE